MYNYQITKFHIPLYNRQDLIIFPLNNYTSSCFISKKSKPRPFNISHRSGRWPEWWKWWSRRAVEWWNRPSARHRPSRPCLKVRNVIRFRFEFLCPPLAPFSPKQGRREAPRLNTFGSESGRLVEPETPGSGTWGRPKRVTPGLWR